MKRYGIERSHDRWDPTASRSERIYSFRSAKEREEWLSLGPESPSEQGKRDPVRARDPRVRRALYQGDVEPYFSVQESRAALLDEARRLVGPECEILCQDDGTGFHEVAATGSDWERYEIIGCSRPTGRWDGDLEEVLCPWCGTQNWVI